MPFRVNVFWDSMASVARAAATGAGFVREIFTGYYISVIEPTVLMNPVVVRSYGRKAASVLRARCAMQPGQDVPLPAEPGGGNPGLRLRNEDAPVLKGP